MEQEMKTARKKRLKEDTSYHAEENKLYLAPMYFFLFFIVSKSKPDIQHVSSHIQISLTLNEFI